MCVWQTTKTRKLALKFQEDGSDSWLCNGNFYLHRIPKESPNRKLRNWWNSAAGLSSNLHNLTLHFQSLVTISSTSGDNFCHNLYQGVINHARHVVWATYFFAMTLNICGSSYKTCFMSLFWRLGFYDGSYGFGKFVQPWLTFKCHQSNYIGMAGKHVVATALSTTN
jgi:hypothetical protein